MNGELAQLIWLAAHGTHFLRTGVLPPLDSTVFQFARSVTFDSPRRQLLKRRERTHVPNNWFKQIKAAGFTEVGVDVLGQLSKTDKGPLPDHIATAFAGGGAASVTAIGPKRAERWTSDWQVWGGERPADNRIWLIKYRGIADKRCRELKHPTIDIGTESLLSSLEAADSFATEHAPRPWCQIFADARGLLDQEHPEMTYHDDLLPKGFDPAGRRLLAAASKAWVFGGMGSWNDNWFEGDVEATYRSVSKSLYAGVTTAIDAAANAR